MKRLFYILLLAVAISSCKSKTEQAATDTTSEATVNDAETQRLITQFKPIIEGVWVKKSYIQSVISTRSPYKSWKEWWGIASMDVFFPKDGKDSTQVGYSLNNHEGSEFVLFLKQGHLPTSLKINLPDYEVEGNFYELGYEINKGETNLVLYHYSAKGKIIDKTLYTKVADRADPDGDAAWGIEYITNKKLFSGTYELIGDNVSSEVKFNDAGKVTGFPNATKYNVLTDFMAGPANNLDQLIFNVYTPEEISYTYKFNADTLGLYAIKPNADSTLLLVDKLKYKLVRKK
jgi:hypothetical protein